MQPLMTLVLLQYTLFVFLLKLYWLNKQAFGFGEDMHLTLYNLHQFEVLWACFGL